MTTPSKNKQFEKILKAALKAADITDLKLEKGYPGEGFRPDWFCNNEAEMWFGAHRHALSDSDGDSPRGL